MTALLGILSFTIFLIPSLSVFAETAEPQASLASQFFEQGRVAVGENQWELAARHFSEAQRADPLRPETLFNLGLAYKMAGSPILASIWFHAFLEAFPESPHTKQVLNEIQELQAQIEAKAEELLGLAQTSAGAIPEEFEDAREEALQSVKRVQAIAGKNWETPALVRIHGEYLAAARDYEGAEALLRKIADPEEKNHLLYTLGNYQIFRNERELALETLRKMNESEEKTTLLRNLIVHYTRELQVSEAEPLLNEAVEESQKIKLKEALILGYVKAGLLEEAKRRALEIKETQLARIVLGKGKGVLEEIQESKPAAGESWRREFDAYQAASALAWLGELKLARSACELAGPGDYGKLARAVVASEEGRFGETLKQMREMSPGAESDFALSLFWRLIQQNRLEEARQLSEVVRSNAAKANLGRILARIYRRKGEADKAAQWAGKSFDLALASNSSLALRSLAIEAAEEGDPELVESAFRIERVTHWIALAREFERKESVRDLGTYFQKFEGGDFIAFTQASIAAAEAWTAAACYISGTEKWHGKG